MVKRLFLSVLFLFMIILPLFCQTVISMEQEGGIYKVPCSVNGVKMKFIFDTGASAVSLSKSMASFMEDGGYLSKKDYLGKTQTRIADGSIIDVEVVNLKDFEIGGLHLKDVIATVKDGQNIPLLMGLSAIEKLGRISIEGNRLVIHNYTLQLSANDISLLRAEINMSYSDGNYETVITKTERMQRATELNDEDYYYYTYALLASHRYDETINACKDWEASSEKDDLLFVPQIYLSYGDAYKMINRPTTALTFYKKSLENGTDWMLGYAYESMAECYYESDRKYDMESCIKKGLSSQYTYLNLSIADVIAGDVSDFILGGLYFQYALYEDTFTNDSDQATFYIKLSAKCGCKAAIDYCFKKGINYTK